MSLLECCKVNRNKHGVLVVRCSGKVPTDTESDNLVLKRRTLVIYSMKLCCSLVFALMKDNLCHLLSSSLVKIHLPRAVQGTIIFKFQHHNMSLFLPIDIEGPNPHRYFCQMALMLLKRFIVGKHSVETHILMTGVKFLYFVVLF